MVDTLSIAGRALTGSYDFVTIVLGFITSVTAVALLRYSSRSKPARPGRWVLAGWLALASAIGVLV